MPTIIGGTTGIITSKVETLDSFSAGEITSSSDGYFYNINIENTANIPFADIQQFIIEVFNSNFITSTDIETNSMNANNLNADSITSTDIETNSMNANNLNANSITSTDLVSESINGKVSDDIVVSSSSSVTDERIAVFDGSTGKMIKEGTTTISDFEFAVNLAAEKLLDYAAAGIFYRSVNGVTLKAPFASVSDTAIINGVTYTKIDTDPGEANAATSVTTGVTDMSFWFFNSTPNGDISHWDTSSVQTMESMFLTAGNTNSNINLQYWDTRNVSNMSSLFNGYLGDVSSLNVEKLDVRNVENFESMFYTTIENDSGSNFVLDLTNWDVSSGKATSFKSMFDGITNYSVNASGWSFNVKNSIDFDQMFESSVGGESDVSNWYFFGDLDTSASLTFEQFSQNSTVKAENWDFSGISVGSGETLNIGPFDWDTTLSTISGWKFDKPTGELGTRNVELIAQRSLFNDLYNKPVVNMSFKNCDSVKLGNLICSAFMNNTNMNSSLENWDFSGASNIELIFFFNGATNFNQPLHTWSFDGATNVQADGMFGNASSFNQDLSSWDFSGFTSLSNFLSGANSFSTANYDALLNRWADQVENDGMSTSIVTTVSATYSAAGADSRQYLLNQGWGITDEGQET